MFDRCPPATLARRDEGTTSKEGDELTSPAMQATMQATLTIKSNLAIFPEIFRFKRYDDDNDDEEVRRLLKKIFRLYITLISSNADYSSGNPMIST